MLHRCDQVVREIDIVGSHPMSLYGTYLFQITGFQEMSIWSKIFELSDKNKIIGLQSQLDHKLLRPSPLRYEGRRPVNSHSY